MTTLENKTKNYNAQCKVVVYKWNSEALLKGASLGELSASTPLDISSKITNVSFTKS